MRTRRYPHVLNLVAEKESPTNAFWDVRRESDGKLLAYMNRQQYNRGWTSAYWEVHMYGGPSFESLGNMDRAMQEINDRTKVTDEGEHRD